MDALGSPMGAAAIEPPFSTRSGFTPKNAGDHGTRSASFADLDRADMCGHAVRDGRVDGVFCDIAAHAQVVVVALLAGERAALALHLVRGLPGADDRFANPTHGLAVRRDHGEGAEVVEDVLGGNRLL